MKKTTIYTIAREAGVSTATVSKILNNQGKVAQETALRVREIISKLNYVPQQRKQHGNAIGVVTFLSNRRPLSSPFVVTLLNGICNEAFSNGRDITLIDSNRISQFSPEELHCFYTANSLSGLLSINLCRAEPFYAQLRTSQLPYVTLSNAECEENSISTKNYESVAEMIDYILCMGHKRVAFLGLLNNVFESHIQRVRAYEDTLARYGIPLRKEFVIDLPDAERSTVKNALLRLLARSNPPTALFFASEDLAVMPILKQLGVKVPEELSVAGMAIAPSQEEGDVELSSVIQQVEEIGRSGVKFLLERLEGKHPKPVILDNLVYYGSTIRKVFS